MKRTNEVAQKIVGKVFSGRRKDNAEVHLSRDELHTYASAAYEVGFQHGGEVKLEPKVAAAIPEDEAVAKAGEAQVDAIHAIAQYVLENEDELRDTLVRGGRLGDRQDLVDDIRKLLRGWRDAGTGVRDAALKAAKVVRA